MQPARIKFQTKSDHYQLDDLWFMVGSLCNLKCIHCYVDSSPENDFLEQIALRDVQSYLQEAAGYGVRSVYFTGGEPFINREIIPMLEESLRHAQTTVLTNATTPVVRHFDQLDGLNREFPGKLVLRVSLDHFQESRHDAIRGSGTFAKSVRNAVELSKLGLRVVITVTPEVFRGNRLTSDTVEKEFQQLFHNQGVQIEVKVLPAVLEMGAQSRRRDNPSAFQIVTEDLMNEYSVQAESLMCYNGRSVLKRNGECRVYPCPVIYEVPEFDLGATLAESLAKPVPLTHRSCAQYCCVGPGKGSCTN